MVTKNERGREGNSSSVEPNAEKILTGRLRKPSPPEACPYSSSGCGSRLLQMATKKEGGQEGDSNSASVWHCGD